MKKPYLIAAALLILTAIIMAIGFREPDEDAPDPAGAYILIVSDDTGAFLMQLRRGAEDAAARLQSRLSLLVAEGDIPDCADKSGAVLYVNDPEALLPLLGCPAVLIGSRLSDTWSVVSETPAEDLPVSDVTAPLAQLTEWLEGGRIDAFYAQDPYAMGYLAVLILAEGGGSRIAPLKRVTRETLYLKENVKLVFPLIE